MQTITKISVFIKQLRSLCNDLRSLRINIYECSLSNKKKLCKSGIEKGFFVADQAVQRQLTRLCKLSFQVQTRITSFYPALRNSQVRLTQLILNVYTTSTNIYSYQSRTQNLFAPEIKLHNNTF